jgi:hypothetical protein
MWTSKNRAHYDRSKLRYPRLFGPAAFGAKQTLGKTPTFAKWHERKEAW